jgi:uncharacterized membrane protein
VVNYFTSKTLLSNLQCYLIATIINTSGPLLRERFNPKELNEGQVKEHYQVTVTNKTAALENLENNGNINRTWDNITENITILTKESPGYCELKYYKLSFDKKCSKLVD